MAIRNVREHTVDIVECITPKNKKGTGRNFNVRTITVVGICTVSEHTVDTVKCLTRNIKKGTVAEAIRECAI